MSACLPQGQNKTNFVFPQSANPNFTADPKCLLLNLLFFLFFIFFTCVKIQNTDSDGDGSIKLVCQNVCLLLFVQRISFPAHWM